MRDPDGLLCKGLPTEFRTILQYCQSLAFETEPDYERIETLLTLIKERHGFDDTCSWHFQEDRSQERRLMIDTVKAEAADSKCHFETLKEDESEIHPEKGEHKRKKSKIIKKVVKIVHQHN